MMEGEKSIYNKDFLDNFELFSPLYKLFADDDMNNIFIKRDDLIPFSFGGNKVRIAVEFIKDMYAQGKNCIIGYGNIKSNLTRAISNLCSKLNIPCYIVSPYEKKDIDECSYNEDLSKSCGALFYECDKNDVAATVETVIKLCESKGYNPYYINGDKYGKGNEVVPVKAYYNTYKEILDYESNENIKFDYIFLPIGTGMTQAGLMCGKIDSDSKCKIVGISIARKKDDELVVLQRYVDLFLAKNKITSKNKDFFIDDSYIIGGYGKYNIEIENIIFNIFQKYGIPLDPTYSGKAFYGMSEYIKKEQLINKNILFIHTGGTPLFFDFIREKHEEVKKITDIDIISKFLTDIDFELPTPLSNRVDLETYARKVLEKGIVLGIKDDKKLVSASFFYANDNSSRVAYLTLLGTLRQYRGLGYAKKLLTKTLEYCKKKSMTVIQLETDLNNKSAISLYSSFGFEIIEVKEKISMKKNISKDL